MSMATTCQGLPIGVDINGAWKGEESLDCWHLWHCRQYESLIILSQYASLQKSSKVMLTPCWPAAGNHGIAAGLVFEDSLARLAQLLLFPEAVVHTVGKELHHTV